MLENLDEVIHYLHQAGSELLEKHAKWHEKCHQNFNKTKLETESDPPSKPISVYQ